MEGDVVPMGLILVMALLVVAAWFIGQNRRRDR